MAFHKAISGKITKLKKSQAVNSSVWVAAGMIGSQGIRLASNILLTRLLVPEYFGMMAIVYSVVGFFAMMSNVGLVPSVVNSKRDEDKDYMSTVWTIQFLRTILLAILVLIVAYPVSYIYDEPLLFPLLIAIAATSIVGGFNSVALILEQKYLRQKKLVLSQFFTQIVSSLVMILVAYSTHSVWSLVIGNTIGAIATLWCSYIYFSPHYSKFRLEREAVQDIVHFGKWIMLSSILSYAGNRSQPIIMGFWVGFKQLGIYSVAAPLAAVIEMVIGSLSNKILFPKYRQYVSEGLIEKIDNLRRKFIFLFLPVTVIIALVGGEVADFLYDNRYKDVGAILQILAIGRIGTLFVLVTKPILISVGDAKSASVNQGITALMSVFLLIMGGVLAGFHGMVLGAILIPFVDYVTLSLILRKHSFYYMSRDIIISVVSIVFILFVWYFQGSRSLEIIVDAFYSATAVLNSMNIEEFFIFDSLFLYINLIVESYG